MKIENIIYDTTRELTNLEDKLKIAVIFLFCEELGLEEYSNFLYAKNHKKYIEDLNQRYINYDIDLLINFENKNIKNAFEKTLKKVIEVNDAKGLYKAISEGDEFALVICEISNYKFEMQDFKSSLKSIKNQLKLNL